MEQARQWCPEAPSHNSVQRLPLSHTAGPNKKQSTLNSSPHQTANLSFTSVTSVSLDPPIPESTLPVSSPSISRLPPDVIQEKPDLDIQPKTLRQRSSRTVTNNLKAPSSQSQQQQQHRKQIRPQTSFPESTAEQRRPQRSSSPSPQTSDSTEEPRQRPNLKEKETAGKRKTDHERREKKKNASSSQRKKSERHGSEPGRSPVRIRHSRGHEGVTLKPEKPSGKSRWQDECQSSARGGRSGNRAPPPSPIHNALGQAVSEVLFASSDSPTQCKTPSSSDSQEYTPPPPPQSPAVSCSGVQQPLQVIDQLMQDAEDSDEEEFEDDPLLQVLRQQRKWVKEQLCEVDLMLQQL